MPCFCQLLLSLIYCFEGSFLVVLYYICIFCVACYVYWSLGCVSFVWMLSYKVFCILGSKYLIAYSVSIISLLMYCLGSCSIVKFGPRDSV